MTYPITYSPVLQVLTRKSEGRERVWVWWVCIQHYITPPHGGEWEEDGWMDGWMLVVDD